MKEVGVMLFGSIEKRCLPFEYTELCELCRFTVFLQSAVLERLGSERTTSVEGLKSSTEYAHQKRLLSYDAYPKLHLERQGTIPEQRLFQTLCNSLLNSRFIHQFELPLITSPRFPTGKQYRPDIYAPDAWLAIEVDGDSHSPAKDLERDEMLFGVGIKTVRFTPAQVRHHLHMVIESLGDELRARVASGIVFDRNPLLTSRAG